MYDYFYPDYLQHYGVKGMKWGVRRKYLNSDGSLNDKGIKKYARKGYAKDSFNSNKTRAGKLFDAYTGAHKTDAKIRYDLASKKQNKDRAEQYLAERNKKSSVPIQKKIGKAAESAANKHREKVDARNKSYEKTVDMFGVGGAAIRTSVEYGRKKMVKGAIAKAVNASANAYISTNSSKYNSARAVDFVRNATVKGLSLSSNIDQIRAYSDVGKAIMYQNKKLSN